MLKNHLRHLSIGLAIAFAMLISIALLPLVAFAQDAPAIVDGIFGISFVQIGVYLAIGLALVEVARRVAEVIPGKRDDEIVSIVDSVLRKMVDFIAGKHGNSSDPSLVKRE